MLLPDQRPRERLLELGADALADAELIALVREPGVGPAKGARVVAALTLARRLTRATGPDDVVASSADIARRRFPANDATPPMSG